MQKIISIQNLSHVYKSGKEEIKALSDISLDVAKGEIFGFLGPNGAGKTTTIKLLLGILTPQKGNLTIFDASSKSPETRRKLGYMPETSDYYRYLTPIEILKMYGDICGVDKTILKKRTEKLLELVDLSHASRRLMSTFSKGMMQKVSFAQALINDPDLLILDEPTGGLDPVARKNMREVIKTLSEEGKTVFFSSHELSEVELVADRIGILHKGRLMAKGPVKDLLGGKETGQSLESYFLDIIGEKA